MIFHWSMPVEMVISQRGIRTDIKMEQMNLYLYFVIQRRSLTSSKRTLNARYVNTAEKPLLPADPTVYFAVVNVKTDIMCIRAVLRIKTTLTNSPAIRKKADYEYRYYKANGNATVQNRR